MDSRSGPQPIATASGRRTRASVIGVVLGSLLALVVVTGADQVLAPSQGWAQATATGSSANWPSGMVTGIGTNTIKIDNKNYPLDPKVTVKDQAGNPMTLKELRPGDQVKFHLHKGRIDQLEYQFPS